MSEYIRTPEMREAARARQLGQKRGPMSEAQKELLRAKALVRPGTPHTPEQLERMRIAHLGKKATPEHAAAISQALKGKPRPTMRGRPQPEAHTEAIAAGLAACYQQRKPTAAELQLRAMLEAEGITDLMPQQPFGRYYVDWYSPAQHTAYEADGHWGHLVFPQHDYDRDCYLAERFGLVVRHYVPRRSTLVEVYILPDCEFMALCHKEI